MKTLLDFKPLFDPVAKTLDFSLFPDFNINKLFAIINVTRNTPIYIPGAAGYGISSVSGSVITLTYDTSAHSATDILNVYYSVDAPVREVLLTDISDTLSQILVELKVQNVLILEHMHRNSFTRNDLAELREDINNPDVISQWN